MKCALIGVVAVFLLAPQAAEARSDRQVRCEFITNGRDLEGVKTRQRREVYEVFDKLIFTLSGDGRTAQIIDSAGLLTLMEGEYIRIEHAGEFRVEASWKVRWRGNPVYGSEPRIRLIADAFNGNARLLYITDDAVDSTAKTFQGENVTWLKRGQCSENVPKF